MMPFFSLSFNCSPVFVDLTILTVQKSGFIELTFLHTLNSSAPISRSLEISFPIVSML